VISKPIQYDVSYYGINLKKIIQQSPITILPMFFAVWAWRGDLFDLNMRRHLRQILAHVIVILSWPLEAKAIFRVQNDCEPLRLALAEWGWLLCLFFWESVVSSALLRKELWNRHFSLHSQILLSGTRGLAVSWAISTLATGVQIPARLGILCQDTCLLLHRRRLEHVVSYAPLSFNDTGAGAQA
jgi:hypothetical protein